MDMQMAGYGALLLRVSLGVMFLAHGLKKVAEFPPAGTLRYFQSLGLPSFVAYLSIAAEIGGGLLLVLGVATRLVALLEIPLIAGTIALVHGKNGWLFANPGGGWEYPAFWCVTLAVLILLGSGPYALLPLFG
ncbi:DoxX family protein [Variovorax terrae]|uniref:DoxX family protein n=1 Tax=Variovorax terrae TaxID=2923278 RepID=A0A9X1VTV2_9BURK|nr:DoxX family protein [Variovorax terrae]MCJ0763123.1 DoxX family protein [Variovorax terrae]